MNVRKQHDSCQQVCAKSLPLLFAILYEQGATKTCGSKTQ